MSPTTFDPTDPRSLARRADVYALAFEVADGALAAQERLLAELRSRGTGIVASAAVTMSVFGGPALGRVPAGTALYVAVAAFAGVCICVLDVLWPRRLMVTTDAEKVIALYAEPRHAPLAVAHRELALHLAASLSHNQAAVHRLMWSSRVALFLLAVEVIAWVVSCAQRLKPGGPMKKLLQFFGLLKSPTVAPEAPEQPRPRPTMPSPLTHIGD